MVYFTFLYMLIRVPELFMVCYLFSKKKGITLLTSGKHFDYLHNNIYVRDF